MKKVIVMFALAVCSATLLSSCGNSSTGSELVGQAKKVINKTPMFCSDRIEADISLGVVRNGTGSMSKEDVFVQLKNPADADLLKKAVESGEIVKITYDDRRFVWCGEERLATKVELDTSGK